jgi:pimeloyl-ACP methyl ester carboxylesterase
MASPNGVRSISKELEEEIYERRLLSQLDYIEKLNKGRNVKNIFLVHNNNGMINQFSELALLLENKYNVYGIQARGLKPGTKMTENPWEMVEDYFQQILAVQKKGAYILGGFCTGNQIAYEIALKMEQFGYPVEKLVLVDSHLIHSKSFYKLFRVLKYLPGFVDKFIVANFKRKFRKEVEAINQLEPSGQDHVDSCKAKMEKYMHISFKYVLSIGIVNAPILIPLAKDSPRPNSTQENFDRLSKNKVTVIRIPGIHNEFLGEPYVNKLSEVIIDNL